MNIGIVTDFYLNSGGGENFVQSELDTLKDLDEIYKNKINFYYITTNKQSFSKLNEKYKNTIYFNKDGFLNRASLFLNTLESIRKFVRKFKLNMFENFLKKKNINFLIFITPSKLVYFCRNINFISTLWELQHKTHPHLEEYKNIHFDLKERDNIAKFISLYSYKILVGTSKSEEDFSKFYNCDKSRIVKKYTQSILVNKAKEIVNDKTDEKLKDYLFYPAQFWSHKNHMYIVDAFNEIKKKNINLKCVFTGSDKGYLNKIKDQINKKYLNEFFVFYNYLPDDEIIKLYMNCKGVIIPSVVGTYTFPHIEAFYFKKIVFSCVENLDPEFKKRVVPIDLKDPKSFLKRYEEFFKKKDEDIDKLLVSNKDFHEKNFSSEINLNIYETLINKYLQGIT